MRDVSRILISLSYVAAFLAVVWLKREKIGQKQGLEMAFSEVNKYYNVQLEKYSDDLQAKFKKLFLDTETNSFLKWSADRGNSYLLQIFYAFSAPLLKLVTTKTATNGILYRGEMFVLSKEQFHTLVDEKQEKYENWLDLGAGDGGALERLGVKDMASTVWTTEICGVMRKRLEWRGFNIKDVEKWDNQQYDVISMLNLLDRAGNPDQFIQKAHSVLNPNGILLIAVVLPFNPYVERGGKDNKPLVDISAYQSSSRNHWDQVENFVNAIQRNGFELATWSVAPYLCEGDQTTSYYTLRDTILVFQKKGE